MPWWIRFLRWLLRRWFLRLEQPTQLYERILKKGGGGRIVYVTKRQSWLDLLLMEQVARRGQLPFAQEFVGMGEESPPPSPLPSGALLCLEGDEGKTTAVLEHLLEAALRHPHHPLLLVPVGVVYGAKPRSVERSFFEILFGPRERAGFLRRLFWILFNPGELRVVFQEPILLHEWVQTRKEPVQQLARKVRMTIRYSLSRVEQTYLGPKLVPRERIIQRALRDHELRTLLESMAKARGLTLRDLEIEAYSIMDEIAADYRWGVIRFLEFILTRVWSRIYEEINVDHEGIERLKRLRDEGPLILIPTHKSHMDYLILSYIFKINDLMPPFIAAGINMSFFPAGIFFRRAGAFFIRRSFIGDRLYELCLKAYLKTLLRERYPIEFFIEGTRSRNGQILPPRLGFLGMVLDGCKPLAQAGMKPHIVPVAIDYEFLIEEKSIVEEAHGKREKQPESFRSLLGAGEKLAHKYGSLYVRFGEPLSCAELLKEGEEEKERVRRIAYGITRELMRRVTVTSTAMVATVLVTHHRRGIAREEFLSRLDLFVQGVRLGGGRLASEFLFGSFDPERSLKVFLRNGIVRELEIHGQIIYSVPDDGRPTLDYYKNTVVHFLVNLSFAAIAFRAAQERTFASLWEPYRILHRIFEEEFHRVYDPPEPEELETLLQWLCEHRIMRRELEFYEVTSPEELVSLENVTRSFLESTYIAVTTLLERRDRGATREWREWQKLAMDMGLLLYAKGDILRPESRNKVGIENALNTLRHRGILEEIASPEGSGGGAWRRARALYRVKEESLPELESTYQFLKGILEDVALTY